MPKLMETPEGDRVPDDDYLDLCENHPYRERLRSSHNPNQPQGRMILTCAICGLDNAADEWDVSYCKPTGQNLCGKHHNEAMAAVKKAKREKIVKEVQDNLDPIVLNLLSTTGMRPLELSASVDKIPTPIACALAEHAPRLVEALTAGDYPKLGAGVVGVARIGKSMALAALLKESFKAYVLKAAHLVDSVNDLERRGFLFCSWAHACATWRNDWEGTRGWRVKLVKDLSTKNLVFLDDLGREGLSAGRTYIDDPCHLLLNDIISERHAYGRPLIWTANLVPGDLSKLYGAAMFERLSDLAPIIEIKGAAPIVRGPHPVV